MDNFNSYYTITFEEFIKDNPTYLADNLKMSTTDRTTKLANMLQAVWFYNEISGETEGEFKIFLLRKFEEYKDYYEEKLNAYEKEYDYATGLIRTRKLTSAKTGKVDTTASSNVAINTIPNLIDTHYDLPNKQTTNEYPSAKDTSTGESNSTNQGSGTSGETNSNNQDDTETYTDNDKFLELKAKYMKQITSLYREFAEKFHACFLHLY